MVSIFITTTHRETCKSQCSSDSFERRAEGLCEEAGFGVHGPRGADEVTPEGGGHLIGRVTAKALEPLAERITHEIGPVPPQLLLTGSALVVDAVIVGLVVACLAFKGGRETLRTYLGTIPDYTTEVKGVKLSGVRGASPAEKAGLKGGDVIVEFAGQKIANIYDYTYALDAVKIGQPVKIIVERDGQAVTLTVTPEARK